MQYVIWGGIFGIVFAVAYSVVKYFEKKKK